MRKYYKKGLFAAMVACMMLALAACGKKEKPKESPEAKTEVSSAAETSYEEEGAEEELAPEGETGEDEGQDEIDAVTSATEYAEKTGMARIDAEDPKEYVLLPRLSDLSIEGKESSEDIDALVEREYRKYEEDTASMKEVEGRGIQEGDMVNMDYVQTVDGKEYQRRQGCYVSVGTGTLVNQEFEEMLIGLEKGQTKTYDYTYAEDFYDTDLAGKHTSVTVTLNGIYVSDEEGLTDEKVQALDLRLDDGSRVLTTEDLRTYIYERKTGAAFYYNRENAIKALVDGAQVRKGFSREMLLAGASCLIGRTVTEDDMTEELEERAFEFVKEALCINMVLKNSGYEGSMAQRARWNAAADYVLSKASVNRISE